MELNTLILRISSPFKLQSAVITGEVLRESELFGLKRGLYSTARERAIIICTSIERIQCQKLIFIGSGTEADRTISLRCRVNYFPADHVARSRLRSIVNDANRVSAAARCLTSVNRLSGKRPALNWCDQMNFLNRLRFKLITGMYVLSGKVTDEPAEIDT